MPDAPGLNLRYAEICHPLIRWHAPRGGRSTMTASPYSLFLSHTIAAAEPGRGLTDDELYGVNTSRCLLRRELPAALAAFWAAVREGGISP